MTEKERRADAAKRAQVIGAIVKRGRDEGHLMTFADKVAKAYRLASCGG